MVSYNDRTTVLPTNFKVKVSEKC